MPDGIFGGVVAGSGGVTSDGGFTARAAGTGFRLPANGAADRAGTALLAGGTKIVATTAVTATCLIYLCHKGDGGAIGTITETKASRIAGTSFVILSSNGGDAGHVDWLIIEPT
jgi:hypothetical protein